MGNPVAMPSFEEAFKKMAQPSAPLGLSDVLAGPQMETQLSPRGIQLSPVDGFEKAVKAYQTLDRIEKLPEIAAFAQTFANDAAEMGLTGAYGKHQDTILSAIAENSSEELVQGMGVKLVKEALESLHEAPPEHNEELRQRHQQRPRMRPPGY